LISIGLNFIPSLLAATLSEYFPGSLEDEREPVGVEEDHRHLNEDTIVEHKQLEVLPFQVGVVLNGL
jgi:hypothetical protein